MGIIPPNEAERLLAVRRYDILDTPPDGAFDRITAIAARLFKVPIAIVSIVDEDRIWFKSHHGLDVKQITRDPGLCASAILVDMPWVIENAKTDIRTLANPLVAGEFGLRFYAGAPLRTRDGYGLGTLCVIDKEPRSFSEDEAQTLADLAAIVMDELELRLSAHRALAAKEPEIREKAQAQEQLRFLMNELKHRVKNSLASVHAIAQQTGKNSASVEEFMGKFEGRLATLTRAHDLLTNTSWSGGTLRDILRLSVEAYWNREQSNIVLQGPDIQLGPRVALALNLVFYELGTNAAKYGALSRSEGRVTIAWTVEPDLENEPSMVLRWIEEGGPAIEEPPSRRGFGSRVLDYSVRHELRGDTRVEYARSGLRVTISFPLSFAGE